MGSAGQISASGAECQGPYSAVNVKVQTEGTAPGVAGGSVDTHFYLGDHLGSAQLELASGGWPVWLGQYAPFGQQLINGSLMPPDAPDTSANNYKFTGKERDAESGVD